MQSTAQNRRVIGIVTEFNPFHKGHQYLIRACRERCGEDSVVICAMSGDFVQRGEPAVFSKYARAEAACRCGADLVVELPPEGSLASAEGFAASAVSLLLGLGMDTLCFGSESGDTEEMRKLAEYLSTEESIEAVKKYLKQHPDCSYAAARERITEVVLGNAARLLSKPNCILGVEYAKALLRAGERGDRVELCAIPRVGVEHDETTGEDSSWKSASELRALLLQGKSISRWIPAEAEDVYRKEISSGRGPVSAAHLEQAALARLRLIPEDAILHCEDGADGLGARLAGAVAEQNGLEEICGEAKTRRYALSRIRRMCWRLALDLDRGETGKTGAVAAAQPAEAPDTAGATHSFARLLAVNEKGREYLRCRSEGLPVLTKTAAVKKMGAKCDSAFRQFVRVHDVYVLAYEEKDARRGGEDWRRGPFIG